MYDTEERVSFATAKLLREANYPQCEKDECFRGWKYTVNGELTTAPYANHYAAPSVYNAMKWLTKEHNIAVIIDVCKVGEEHKTMYAWTPVVVMSDHLEYPISQTDGTVFGGLCDEYDEACDKCIKYCLTDLILKKND